MKSRSFGVLGCICLSVVLAGCAQKRELSPFAVTQGPDEFSLVPNKPLQAPDSFAALPAPTPTGTNIADATPKADLITLLGGRVASTGVDGGIVTYASRYGVDPAIRSSLGAADERKQKRARAVPFRFGKYSYERSYRSLALDPWAEWERLRALGVVVPAAPAK